MAEALYRKYRPQVFADVVGQDHIVRTLQNAIEQGKVSHAYLFCGPRGTGKTTMARLLSKAMLCHEGPTPNPDGTCEDCQLIAEGAHPDVYELDAASRTGVENVREEIIGRVQFSPTRGASKVYIIDEVHMLSTAAFNALLKTLEEPPSHVIFVLCTTDPQKVPETIHSRCQRFDFRRIGQDEMVAKLGAVCVAEGAQFEGEALELVAHRADGGMRNALTALEQLIAFSGGNVTMAAAEDMLGGLNVSDVASIVGLIGTRDAAACFAWVARYVETGGDLAQFARDLAEHLRNMYVMSLAGADVPLDVSEAVRSQMAEALPMFGPDRLARALCVLGDLIAELKTSTNARLSFEIACIRLTRPQTDLTLESLAERVERLEREGVQMAPAAAVASAAAASAEPNAASRAKAAAYEAVSAAASVATSVGASAAKRIAGSNADASAKTDVASRAKADVASNAAHQEPSMDARTQEAEVAAQSEERQADSTATAAAPDNAWAKAAGNPAALSRLWQQVLAVMKRDRGPHAVLFMNTRVAYDAVRGVVNIVFAQGNQFAFKTAQKPEVAQSLAAACQAALGAAIPFAFMREGETGAQPAAAATQAQPQASSAQERNVQPQQASQRSTQAQQSRQQKPDQGVRQAQATQVNREGRAQADRREQSGQRGQQSQQAQRGQQSQQPAPSVDDEVPLELYDDMAPARDGRYDNYDPYAEQATSGGKQTQTPKEAKPADAEPAPKREADPQADAAWRGNLEEAFGSVSVQQL